MNDIDNTCKNLKKYIKNTFKGYNAEQIKEYCKEHCDGHRCNNCIFRYNSSYCIRNNTFKYSKKIIKVLCSSKFNIKQEDIKDDLGFKIRKTIELILKSEKFKGLENTCSNEIKDDDIRRLLMIFNTFSSHNFYITLNNILNDKVIGW